MDMKALIVATNHSDFEHPKADPTGLWLSELTHFYDEFDKAGVQMDVVSPRGGKIPIDGRSLGRLTLGKTARRRYEGHAMVDERLITGQNPNSARRTTQKTLEVLGVDAPAGA